MIERLDTRRTQNAFWNFKPGLTLRFLGALRSSPHPALQSVGLQHGERMDKLDMILRQQVERSSTPRDNGTEIRTAVTSAEANSETQPWVTLGFFGRTGRSESLARLTAERLSVGKHPVELGCYRRGRLRAFATTQHK